MSTLIAYSKGLYVPTVPQRNHDLISAFKIILKYDRNQNRGMAFALNRTAGGRWVCEFGGGDAFWWFGHEAVGD